MADKPRKSQLSLKRKLSLPVQGRYNISSGNQENRQKLALSKIQDDEEGEISLSNLDSVAASSDDFMKSQDDHERVVPVPENQLEFHRNNLLCIKSPDPFSLETEHRELDNMYISEQSDTQNENTLKQYDQPFLDMSLVDASEMENTCLVALSGVSLSGYLFEQHPEMVSYVKQVFKFDDEKFQKLYQKATRKQSCELKLACRVNSGHALQLKDSKGHTPINPVCILTILHSRNQKNSLVLHDNVKVWLEKGVIDSIMTSTTKQNTSSPIWKESFKLPLQDVSEEMLVVEVWSDDKSIKSSKKFYDKKAKNFIGRCFYLLRTVPVGGEEKTLTLYSHSGKHQRGQIKLNLNVHGLEDSTPPDVAHRSHKILFKVLVDHDSKTDGKYYRKWDVQLCNEARRLYTEHVSLTKLSEVRQACVQLSVLVDYHKQYGISFTALKDVMKKIEKNYSKFPDDDQPKPLWVKQVILDMQELVSSLLNDMQDHLTLFNLKSADDLLQIKHMIHTLQTIYSFHEVVQRLSPQNRDLKSALVLAIQVSVPRWFFELSKNVIEDGTVSDCSGMELVAIRGLCLHCLRNCLRVQKNLNPIFAEVSIDYYTAFYLELDKLLFGEIISRLELRSKEKDPIMYELYVIFKDMAKLTESMQLTERERKDLRVLSYHLWFNSIAVNWIDSALKKGRERIELAIEKDKPEEVQMENQARFSSSAVDASYFILQIGTFWKNLQWPVAAEAYGYLCTIIESISELALYYVDELYKFLLHDSSIMYDDNGRFRVHEKLCIGLNNMYHVKKALKNMPSSMELEKYYEWLEKEEGIGERARHLVDNLMNSNEEDISNKISYFLDLIAQKLSTDVHQFFDVLVPTSGNLRHRSGTVELALPHFVFNFNPNKAEKLTDEEIIEPILDYLTANLQTLGDYLLTPVLHGILHPLWGFIVGMMQAKIAIIPRKSSSAEVYRQLEFVLGELKSFFHCDGNGVCLVDLDTEACKTVELRLKLLQTPTRELINMFYTELAERQAFAVKANHTPVGTIDLIVAYLKDKEAVEVAVVQARNLPEVSKNGLSDPLVELTLVPDGLFPKCSHMQFKTTPQKQTLNPVFSTEFLMPTISDKLSNESATLLAAVFQYDTNELIGLGALPCNEIPQLLAHITSLQSTSVPERKKVTLPLISVSKTPILNELEARWEIGDSEATEFCKSKRKLLHKMELRKPNFKWLSSL